MDNTFKVHNFFSRIANLGDIKKKISAGYEGETKAIALDDESRDCYETLIGIAGLYLSDALIEEINEEVEHAALYAEQIQLNALDIDPMTLAQYEDYLHESYARQESHLEWSDYFDNDREAGGG